MSDKRGINRAEYQFYVIAQVHAQCRLDKMKNSGNLSLIGRDLGLTDVQVQSLRGKAVQWAKNRGRPKGVDDKLWIQPTPIENRMAAA